MADPAAADTAGNTPAHLAAMHGHWPALAELVRGRRVDLEVTNRAGLSARDIARARGGAGTATASDAADDADAHDAAAADHGVYGGGAAAATACDDAEWRERLAEEMSDHEGGGSCWGGCAVTARTTARTTHSMDTCSLRLSSQLCCAVPLPCFTLTLSCSIALRPAAWDLLCCAAFCPTAGCVLPLLLLLLATVVPPTGTGAARNLGHNPCLDALRGARAPPHLPGAARLSWAAVTAAAMKTTSGRIACGMICRSIGTVLPPPQLQNVPRALVVHAPCPPLVMCVGPQASAQPARPRQQLRASAS